VEVSVNLFPWFLLLHILGAIVAFGPTFAFPLIGSMGGKEPMHANFATRVSEKISHGITFPLAIVQGITGVGLIVTGNVDLTRALWLDIAIVLYLTALSFSYFVQTPRVARVIEMTSRPPAGAPSPAMASSAPAPAMAAAGAMGGDMSMAAGYPGGTGTGTAGAAPAAGGSAGGPPSGAAPAGPPPEVRALIKQVQQGGMILTGLIVVIVPLMVVRPVI
jgi:uncharacterized membrane protein